MTPNKIIDACAYAWGITKNIESDGKPELGAPTDKQVFIIKFKKGGQNNDEKDSD